MTSNWNLPKILLFASMLVFSPVLTACDGNGPAEEAGEAVDEAGERAGEAVEDAGEAIEDATQD